MRNQYQIRIYLENPGDDYVILKRMEFPNQINTGDNVEIFGFFLGPVAYIDHFPSIENFIKGIPVIGGYSRLSFHESGEWYGKEKLEKILETAPWSTLIDSRGSDLLKTKS